MAPQRSQSVTTGTTIQQELVYDYTSQAGKGAFVNAAFTCAGSCLSDQQSVGSHSSHRSSIECEVSMAQGSQCERLYKNT